MKALLFTIAVVAGFAAPAADAGWRYGGYGGEHYAQAPKDRGAESRERAQPQRETRPERRPEREYRRERLNDDERRALHRDLDKANRELYQGRK